ncbi:hypothetical protein ACIGO9_30390 [Nocardia asteroides]|uniref:hypothetical protein n=1 Tax=Nocardia asteroides TaxID=1824 RepID=UPI0037C7C9CB
MPTNLTHTPRGGPLAPVWKAVPGAGGRFQYTGPDGKNWHLWHTPARNSSWPLGWYLSPAEDRTVAEFLVGAGRHPSQADLAARAAALRITAPDPINVGTEPFDRAFQQFGSGLRQIFSVIEADSGGSDPAVGELDDKIRVLARHRATMSALFQAINNHSALPTWTLDHTPFMIGPGRAGRPGCTTHRRRLEGWVPVASPSRGDQIAIALARTHLHLLDPDSYPLLTAAGRAYVAGATATLPHFVELIAQDMREAALTVAAYLNRSPHYDITVPVHHIDPDSEHLNTFLQQVYRPGLRERDLPQSHLTFDRTHPSMASAHPPPQRLSSKDPGPDRAPEPAPLPGTDAIGFGL